MLYYQDFIYINGNISVFAHVQEARWPILSFFLLYYYIVKGNTLYVILLSGLCNYVCVVYIHLVVSFPRIRAFKIERSFNPSPLFLQMRKLKQKVWFVQRTFGDRSSFLPSVRFPFSTTYSNIHCLSQNWVNNTTESLCVLFFILRS